jgi:pimeloyl-ACP methyl ester carboxylesterase
VRSDVPDRVPSTDDVVLAVHDLDAARGPAPSPDTRPLLLLAHATGFHGRVWEPFAAALTDRFRVVSWDFRGHGDSLPPADEAFRWKGFGEDVCAVLDALGLGAAGGPRPFACGHSKGGAALLMAELARPGTFAGLWLFEPIVPPPMTIPGPTENGNRLANGARRRREVFASKAEAEANYASKPPLGIFDPAALHAYVDHGFAEQPDGTVRLKCRGEWEARVFEMGGQHGTFERLGEIRCPVTIAAGAEAPLSPASFAPVAAERIPGCRFVRFDDLDHFGPLEQPTRMAEAAASAFLSG